MEHADARGTGRREQLAWLGLPLVALLLAGLGDAPLWRALLGVAALWGLGPDLGAALARRTLGVSVPWAVEAAAGIAVTSSSAMLLSAVGAAEGASALVPMAGFACFTWSRWRGLRASGEAEPVEAVDGWGTLGVAWTCGGLAFALAMPNYLVDARGMRVEGFALIDGLWFAGSARALDMGLPPPDLRMVGETLGYHYLSLAWARVAAWCTGSGQAFIDAYLVVPFNAAVAGAAASEVAAFVSPRCRGRAARWLTGLGTVFLPDGASLMRWLGAGMPPLREFFEAPVPHFVFGSHRTIGMLVNLPLAVATTLGLAACWVYLRGRGQPAALRARLALWLGALVFTACMAKGSVAPLAMGLGIAGYAWWWVVQRRRHPERWVSARRELLAVGLGGLLAYACLRQWTGPGVAKLAPGYMVDFLRNYARAHKAIYASWGLDRAWPVLAAYLLLGLGWMLWILRPGSAAARSLHAWLGLAWLGGVTLANLVEFELVGGANELTLVSYPLALMPPLVFASIAQLRRPSLRALALVSLLPGLFGAAHLLKARRLAGAGVERQLSPVEVEMYAWLREQSPPDAVVAYFRTTTLDGDPRRPRVPTNDQHYLVSGLGERQSVSGGSFYASLWKSPRLPGLRADIARLYAGEMSLEEAQSFWRREGVTHLIDEPGTELGRYAKALESVWSAGDRRIWRVR